MQSVTFKKSFIGIFLALVSAWGVADVIPLSEAQLRTIQGAAKGDRKLTVENFVPAANQSRPLDNMPFGGTVTYTLDQEFVAIEAYAGQHKVGSTQTFNAQPTGNPGEMRASFASIGNWPLNVGPQNFRIRFCEGIDSDASCNKVPGGTSSHANVSMPAIVHKVKFYYLRDRTRTADDDTFVTFTATKLRRLLDAFEGSNLTWQQGNSDSILSQCRDRHDLNNVQLQFESVQTLLVEPGCDSPWLNLESPIGERCAKHNTLAHKVAVQRINTENQTSPHLLSNDVAVYGRYLHEFAEQNGGRDNFLHVFFTQGMAIFDEEGGDDSFAGSTEGMIRGRQLLYYRDLNTVDEYRYWDIPNSSVFLLDARALKKKPNDPKPSQLPNILVHELLHSRTDHVYGPGDCSAGVGVAAFTHDNVMCPAGDNGRLMTKAQCESIQQGFEKTNYTLWGHNQEFLFVRDWNRNLQQGPPIPEIVECEEQTVTTFPPGRHFRNLGTRPGKVVLFANLGGSSFSTARAVIRNPADQTIIWDSGVGFGSQDSEFEYYPNLIGQPTVQIDISSSGRRVLLDLECPEPPTFQPEPKPALM